MKKKVGLAVLLVVVLVLSSLFAFGGVFAKQPDNGAGSGPPLTIVLMGYGWYTGIPEGQTNNAEDVAMALDGEMIFARDENGRVVAMGMVHGFSVPVVWDVVFPMIEAAVEELDADIILGLGTGPPLQMEKYGCNVMSGADAWDPETDIRYCGYTKIDPDGPDFRQGTLPFEQMVIACLKAGIPARLGYTRGYSACPTTAPSPKIPPCEDDWAACPEVFPEGRPSASPGSYMCNYMSYGIPMLIEDHGWDAIGGFIHIQTRPEYKTMGRVADIEALGPVPDPEALEDLLNNSIGAATSLDRNIKGVRIALQECVRAAAGF